MRIENASVSLAAESQFVSKTAKQETLEVWNRPSAAPENTNENFEWINLDKLPTYDKPYPTQKNEEAGFDFELSEEDKRKIELIEKMLEWLTGKKAKLQVPKSIRLKTESLNDIKLSELKANSNANTNANGFGLHYTYSEQKTTQESLAFKAVGKVATQDGRNISFDLNVNVSRTFVESKSLEIKMGQAMVDPLVINFSGDVPSLNNKTIQFDIDTDGKLDNLPFFNNGGYLAFDKNQDGVINNGTELFGPATQNGFAELAEYDGDRNGWIDENDEIFDKLVVWTMDENGKQELLAASRADVGAIYLGNVDTNLRLLDQQNNMVANMSRGGIYLKESGGAATIQHVDIKL